MRPHSFRKLVLLLFPLAACSDNGVMAPAADPVPVRSASFDCTAHVAAGTVTCAPTQPRTPAGTRAIVLGGQGSYVYLMSSDAAYDGASFFTVDVRVLNLLGQKLGTADGVTPHPDGIRVFFSRGPTVTASTGPGSASVFMPDGTGAVVGSDEPYFQYDEVLTAFSMTADREWQFLVHPNVTTFTFGVLVTAAVPDESALETIDYSGRSIALGGFHSCAVATGGDAYCWGTNDDLQLGSAAADSSPQLVSGGHSWESLTAGLFHTCGIAVGGAAYCWGDNANGQLGNTGEADTAVPVAVEGGRTWAMLSAGARHTCGVTTSGEAFCWGEGVDGKLGNGDTAPSQVPVQVLADLRWASVTAGYDHTCGVSVGGIGACWGNNGDGQLGNGDGAASSPVIVPGDHSWSSISAGQLYSCGVTSLGEAFCWGSDSSGQLGNGGGGGGLGAGLVEVAGSFDWARVTGGRETTCGITTDDVAYCWGFNNTGEIGNNSTTFTDAPEAVAGGHNWSAIDHGDYHTCGVTLSGVVRCWGYNAFGQLGDASSENRTTPALVAGGHSWRP